MNTDTAETVAHGVMDAIWDAIGVNGQFFVYLAIFMIFGIIMLYMHDDFRPSNQGFWKWLGVQIWKDLWKNITESCQEKKDTSDGEGENHEG